MIKITTKQHSDKKIAQVGFCPFPFFILLLLNKLTIKHNPS